MAGIPNNNKMPRSKQHSKQHHSMSAAPGGKIAGKKHPGKAILAGKTNIVLFICSDLCLVM